MKYKFFFKGYTALWPITNHTISHWLGPIFARFCLFNHFSSNVRSQFMALKRVANINGCHSLTVGRKYKSRHSLESRHWYLSSDAIKIYYWQMKSYLYKGYILPKKSIFFRATSLWPITNQTFSLWLVPIFAHFCSFLSFWSSYLFKSSYVSNRLLTSKVLLFFLVRSMLGDRLNISVLSTSWVVIHGEIYSSVESTPPLWKNCHRLCICGKETGHLPPDWKPEQFCLDYWWYLSQIR